MEFNADPADLHRDYQFTNIRYADKTLLNVSVIVDESNYAVLHVSSSAGRFFAADAALSAPIPLRYRLLVICIILLQRWSKIGNIELLITRLYFTFGTW